MHPRAALLLLCCVLALRGSGQCLSGDCKNGTGKMDIGYAVYEGAFKDGQPHGTGTMDYGGGDKYTGEWRSGKEHGTGTLYKKGIASTVFYSNGVLQVAARKVEPIGGNGDYLEKIPGCTTGDCRNGYGEISFPSGNRYKGSFKNGVAHGAGKWTFASGNFFEGEFVANTPTTGRFYYADVNTTFAGTVNADGTPRTGTYTSPGIDGVVDILNGAIIAERHPRRDSINAAATKYAAEHKRCEACEGKGQYMHTSYSPISSTRSEGVQRDGLGGGYVNVVSYKTTGGFAQNMVTCPKCKGTGEVKRR